MTIQDAREHFRFDNQDAREHFRFENQDAREHFRFDNQNDHTLRQTRIYIESLAQTISDRSPSQGEIFVDVNDCLRVFHTIRFFRQST